MSNICSYINKEEMQDDVITVQGDAPFQGYRFEILNSFEIMGDLVRLRIPESSCVIL